MRRPSPTSAKRWTLKLALCLLAGAVVTWGVAWGCALWSPLDYVVKGGVRLGEQESGPWLALLPPSSPSSHGWDRVPSGPHYTRLVQRFDKSGPGLRTTAYYMQVQDDRPELVYTRAMEPPRFTTQRLGTSALYEAGWPLTSLSYARRVMDHAWGTPVYMTLENGLPAPRSLRPRPLTFDVWAGVSERALPLRILPLGFALNTLFYAAVLLGVVECVAFARRRARWSKGRCPSCGYDRAGLAEGAACPECGPERVGGS